MSMFLNNSVFLFKGYLDVELENIASSANKKGVETIVITRDIVLNSEMIDKICKYFKGGDIRVSISVEKISNGTLFDETETSILKQNVEKLENNNFTTLFIEGEDISKHSGYSLDELIQSGRKISDFAKMINEAKVSNRELSPLEKFLFAYDLVTGYVYHKNNSETLENCLDSRKFENLSSDKIICIGRASMLAELCKQIGVPCILQPVIDGVNEKLDFNRINYLMCKVCINDPIYNCNGIYNSDPNRDAVKKGFGKTINHALLTDGELETFYDQMIRLAGRNSFHSESMRDFMKGVMGENYFEPDKTFTIESYGNLFDSTLIKLFSDNAERLEEFKESVNAKLLSEEDVEKMFFKNICDELYRISIHSTNECAKRRLESDVMNCYAVSSLPLEELFAEIINYANKYQPDEDMIAEASANIDDINLMANYEVMQDRCNEANQIDYMSVYYALISAYYSRYLIRDLAFKKADMVFEESIKHAALRWNLNEPTENYFQKIAIAVKSNKNKVIDNIKKLADSDPMME